LQGNRKPALRGKEEFVQVSWEVALGLSAKAILHTIEKHGNEAVFSSSYGGCSMTTGDYSGGAAQIIMPYVIGDMEVYSAQTTWEQVRDNTEVLPGPTRPWNVQ
jgi:trimethylamine-N-oxide reductase (cytochrome c)